MYPDEMKGIMRVVVVIHFDRSVEAVINIIQFYIDLIIYLLLPVGGLAKGNVQEAIGNKQAQQLFQTVEFIQK